MQYSHPPVIAGGARRTEPRKYLLEDDPRFRRAAEHRHRRARELGSAIAHAARAQLEGAHLYQAKMAVKLQDEASESGRRGGGGAAPNAVLTVRHSTSAGSLEPDSFQLRARGFLA